MQRRIICSPDAGSGGSPDAGSGRSPDAGSGRSPDAGSGCTPDAGSGRSPDAGSGCTPDSSVADYSLPLSVSEDDLRTELSLLGFPAVPRHRLIQFKEDLEHLMRSRAALETHSGNSSQSEKENVPASWLLEGGSDWEKMSDRPRNVSSLRQVQLDSYSKHTVSLGARGQEKTRVPAITRKVLRKTSDGQVEVCDESTLCSEEEVLSVMEESLDWQTRPSYTPSADCVTSFIRMPPFSLLEQYRQHSDPVSRYHEYKQSWTAVQRALERSKKELRLEVRERMMSAPPAPLPRLRPSPNTYIIPTDKKRYGLRWAIRQDLANGNIPRGSSS